MYTVRAGKFRRYHGEGLRQLLDVPTFLKNVRDFFLVIAGFWQSYFLLRKLKPNALFVKGGYVVVPVGLAAALQHIPYVTHDSDAVPGLANRIVGRWATLHAVGLPKEVYAYPAEKTITVGVPISHNFQAVTQDAKERFRHEIGLEHFKQLLFITGGGLGAQRLNEAVAEVAPKLLAANEHLGIVHVVGRDHEKTMSATYAKSLPTRDMERVKVLGFTNDLYQYSGAADVVITRAGATNLAEFALQAKACIIVPNPQLTGGHQTKNAEVIAKSQAAVVLEDAKLEKQSSLLTQSVQELLDSKEMRQQLGLALHRFARPTATKELAKLILGVVR